MELSNFLPGIITIVIMLLVMLRLMHYAHFYAPSYLFWIGCIIAITGIFAIFVPLPFLLIANSCVACGVASAGAFIAIGSLFLPVQTNKSKTSSTRLDEMLPEYSFNEVHTVRIKASAEKIKNILHETGVNDIPLIHFLLKIRGIADEDVDMSDRAAKSNCANTMFTTPDFNFFVLTPDEFVTFMILKTSMLLKDESSAPPPEVNSPEEFLEFNKHGYVKVAINFLFEPFANDEMQISTETRILGTGPRDSQKFAKYWRVIYPGSAMIRRVWLDTIKSKAEATK